MSDEIQIVNFAVGEANYGVPVEQVREILGMHPIDPVPGAQEYLLGIANLRGQIIQIVDLKMLLNITSDNSNYQIIWVQRSDCQVGIIVEDVTEVSTIGSEDYEISANDGTGVNRYILGIGKQDDKLVIIMDLHKLIDSIAGELILKKDVTNCINDVTSMTSGVSNKTATLA